MIKVIIVDDDLLIRDSLKIILDIDSQIEIINTASNGFEAIELVKQNNVDVVLLDIRMPLMNGIECLKWIKENTDIKVLLLTTFDEEKYIIEAIKYKVDGYLLKNSTPEKIKQAIKAVYSGNIVLDETVVNKMQIQNSNTTLINYSERENQIIELIAKGYSNKQIANELNITEGTTKNYITTILQKSGLEHRTQIAIYYLKGLL